MFIVVVFPSTVTNTFATIFLSAKSNSTVFNGSKSISSSPSLLLFGVESLSFIALPFSSSFSFISAIFLIIPSLTLKSGETLNTIFKSL